MRIFLHAIYTALVLFVSLWPREYVDTYVSKSVQQHDNWIHILCFLGLAAVSLWAYGNRESSTSSRKKVFLFCLTLGILLEVMQAHVPGINRHGSLEDVAENTLGTLLGLGLPMAFWPGKREDDR